MAKSLLSRKQQQHVRLRVLELVWPQLESLNSSAQLPEDLTPSERTAAIAYLNRLSQQMWNEMLRLRQQLDPLPRHPSHEDKTLPP